MPFPPLKMAAYLAATAAKVRINLSGSGAQSHSLETLLALADPDLRQRWRTLSLDYAPSQGDPLLRETLASLYQVEPNQVLTCAGAVEGVFSLCATLLSAQDHVVVITPCFEPLWAIPTAMQAQVSCLRLTGESHGWSLDLDALAQQIRANTRLIIFNFPHNPTGHTLSAQDFNAVLSLAEQANAWVLSDEVFRGLEQHADQRLPVAATCYPKAISLGVASKAMGLGGVRVGWLVSQDVDLLQQICNRKYYTSVCNGATDELLTCIALRAQNALLAENMRIIRQNHAHLAQFMQQHTGLFSYRPTQVGCVVYPTLNSDYDITRFFNQLLDIAGILLLPSAVFQDAGQHFRLGFGRQHFAEDLTDLATAITRMTL